MLKGVLISSVDQMPLTDERIGTNEKFIQIGCDGCPNKVCLMASGIAVAEAVSNGPGFDENESELRVMYQSITDIDKGMNMDRYGSYGWVTTCEDPCPDEELIKNAVKRINRRYKSDLQQTEIEG